MNTKGVPESLGGEKEARFTGASSISPSVAHGPKSRRGHLSEVSGFVMDVGVKQERGESS